MNLLTDILPESIDVCGASYPVNTDFRTWIRFENLIDGLQTEPEQTAVDILKLCFKTEKTAFKLPSSLSETLKALFEFYTGKSLSEETDGTKAKAQSQRIYSFEHDGEYIYAGFMQQYGIDLCKSDMHWYRFKALFSSLTDETKIGEIMGIRAISLEKISDKKQRSYYARLKRLYALPDTRSEDEKENDLADMIDGMF